MKVKTTLRLKEKHVKSLTLLAKLSDDTKARHIDNALEAYINAELAKYNANQEAAF